jgi:glycosyltransferase involved in cell wall biosynthesis
MTEPAVSVVIPALDEEAYIGQAIESVLAQTLPASEVIVVDDGSTDATAMIAAGYDGVRVLSQPNRGLGAARNAGFAASSGDLLAFHDADDLMLPEKLEVQARYLAAHPACGVVLGSQRLQVEEGADLPFWARGEALPHEAELAGRFALPEGDGTIHTMTMLVRRQAFVAVGPFDEELRIAQDLDWLFRAFEEGVGVDLAGDEVLVRRIHPASLTQDDAQTRHELFVAFKKRIERRRARS